MPTPLLTTKNLDALKCSSPKCKHEDCELFLHPKCHEGGGTMVSYQKGSGEILIACNVCGKHIVRIMVV